METYQQDLSSITFGEIELIYKRKGSKKLSERPKITSSHEAAVILRSIWNMDKIDLLEEFKVLLLNRRNRLLDVYMASSGGVHSTVADPKLILVAALKANACAIMLAHNHPSGSVKPSEMDKDLTQKIKNACSYLDIQLLDHLIITSEEYFSFADEGLL